MTEHEPVAPVVRWDVGKFLAVVVLVGVGAGLGGSALTLFLHFVQHMAFGYEEESFLQGVEQASSARRVVMMALGGSIVGVGWYLLRRWTEVPSVAKELRKPQPSLPFPRTALDALLQVVAVGFGGSLGREGAPRQLGAAIGLWLATKTGMNLDQQRTLLACGAGAGLAAVYNVPLAGALFTLEILLVTFAVGDVLAALSTSAIATGIAWIFLTDSVTYKVETFDITASIVVFAVLFGPIAGVGGALFTRLMDFAQEHAPTGWRLPVAITVVFTAVGFLAIPFPQLLGNGKGPAQLAFDAAATLPLFLTLVLLKPVTTAACLASGAKGGTLTPALATGAMLGAALGGAWSSLWAGSTPGAFALVGAAAFLATTHRAPMTAIVLVLELTHSGNALLVPILVAVVSALVVSGHRPWTVKS